MAIRSVDIIEFLELSRNHPVLDVRSPGEYNHAHIPAAYSFPLFNDEERAVVGTIYKQRNRKEAIRKGIEYFGPRLNTHIDRAERILAERKAVGEDISDTVLVHCWRGGMRSAGIGWLLSLYGYNVIILSGGYKAYRKWVLEQFERAWVIKLVGGYTGSAKTEIIEKLASQKLKYVVNLEKLAAHRGSAFGAIGQAEKQPTQEMFENKLANTFLEIEVRHLEKIDRSGSELEIWIEDESQRIGTVNIPQPLWNLFLQSELVFLDIPFEKRLEHIIQGYGRLDKNQLIAATARLQKKLGGLETKMAVNFLIEGDIKAAFDILLRYYDKLYSKSFDKKKDSLKKIRHISMKDVDVVKNVVEIMKI